MQEVTGYPNGTFSWLDLATTDTAAAKAFYTNLFDWSAIDTPAGESMMYTMFQLAERDVAGMGDLMPEQQAQGIPPHWMSYIYVDDLDATLDIAAKAGGTILMPAFQVLEAGRMAVVQDPAGAIFSMWEEINHMGAKLVNMPGTLCWNELMTGDTAVAAAFYETVFGWETQVDADSGYMMFLNNGRAAGGLMETPEEMKGMPPNWGIYLAVADCDASAAKAEAAGGKLIVPPQSIPGTGKFSVVQDPQGAVFSIIQMEQMDGPPSRD